MYAELHRHLQGSFPLHFFESRLLELPAAKVYARMPKHLQSRFAACKNVQTFLQSGAFKDLFVYSGFMDFAAAYVTSLFTIDGTDCLRRGISALISNLKEEQITYVELIVAPREYMLLGISLEDLAAALKASQIQAHTVGVQIEWILEPVRNFGCQSGLELLRQIKQVCPSLFLGITLGGDELNFPARDFAKLFHEAREMGLHCTAHAGETDGPQSIWDALKILQVERVGHGVRAIEDPALVEYLSRRQVPLEICISANLALNIFRNIAAHPIKHFVERGIPVSISTDDPTLFSTSLQNEYALLELALGASSAAKVISSSWDQRFATTTAK